MTKLDKYLIKTDLFQIIVIEGKKETTFNLARELKVSELQINEELKRQPSKYGFALFLHGKLKTNFEELKLERKKIRGRLYRKAKQTKVPSTGRPMSDDAAKAYVESHPQFLKISRRCIRAKDEADQMYSVVRAFEQRSNLIQSISSNLRNEKGN